jgi:ketosteroid isomerase-like protein
MQTKKVFAYAIVFMVGACAQQTSPAFDSEAEGNALLKRDAEWSNLATQGKDVEKVISYWADDAVILFPGQPVVQGKPAIRNYVAQSFNTPGFRIHWVSAKPVFSPDGKMAYMRATEDLNVPGADGKPITVHLRGVSIWRKDSDGVWRCVVDAANEEPSPAAPTR